MAAAARVKTLYPGPEWDVDTRTIVVDRRLPPAEKRGAFLHELDHAWSDWKLWVAQNVPVKYPDAMEPDPTELDDELPMDVAPTGPVTAPPDQTVEYPTFDMLRAEMEAFAHSIESRTPYPVPIADVLHGMAVFDAIVESARTGRIVTVAS